MKRKGLRFFVSILAFLLLLFLLRQQILHGIGSFLIVEREVDYVDYAFVLSGGAYDRGNKAAELFKEGKIGTLVCTGANQSGDIKALGLDKLECDLTELQILQKGVPASKISAFPVGTSTQEEADFILAFCKEKQLNKILVISSKFHTRRVHQVFTKRYGKQEIEVYIAGAPSSVFNEDLWWENEYGLIAVNNEYLKQFYYLVYN